MLKKERNWNPIFRLSTRTVFVLFHTPRNLIVAALAGMPRQAYVGLPRLRAPLARPAVEGAAQEARR